MTEAPDEFATLVARHRPELHRHCSRMLGSSAEAEDAVQDALLRAWSARHTFRHSSSHRTWLYRIATNACLDAIARRRRPAAFGDEAPEPVAPREHEPEAVVVSRETVDIALSVAARLPARQRASLVLRDVLGYTAAETATALSLSVPATTSALQRARCGLRTHLACDRLDWAHAPATA